MVEQRGSGRQISGGRARLTGHRGMSIAQIRSPPDNTGHLRPFPAHTLVPATKVKRMGTVAAKSGSALPRPVVQFTMPLLRIQKYLSASFAFCSGSRSTCLRR